MGLMRARKCTRPNMATSYNNPTYYEGICLSISKRLWHHFDYPSSRRIYVRRPSQAIGTIMWGKNFLIRSTDVGIVSEFYTLELLGMLEDVIGLNSSTGGNK